jgi:hypothetical protein
VEIEELEQKCLGRQMIGISAVHLWFKFGNGNILKIKMVIVIQKLQVVDQQILELKNNGYNLVGKIILLQKKMKMEL